MTSYLLDQPATEDTLGRKHFADALSRSLLLPKDSPGIVVGIEGAWGSGKSTLIGFITAQLAAITEGDVPVLVEFNPWMVSSTGALVEALIVQLAASIGTEAAADESAIKTGQKLLNYVGLLKHLKYLKYVPGASWAGHIVEDVSGIAESVATAAEEGTDAGQKTLDDVKKLLPTVDLVKQKNAVVTALAELNRPIVVVIDDLDRLPAEEIRAMIQAIKAVADFPRVTYLLAYERSVVARALGTDEKSGLSYLEKIVQVAYPIPPLFQRQLRRFAEEKIHALLATLKINLLDYEQSIFDKALTILAQLSRYPRDIVRIYNRLLLSLPATRGEVNSVDVILFEALSQRFPEIRDAIHNHPSDFIGHMFRGDLIDEDDAFNWGYSQAKHEKGEGRPWEKHLPKEEKDRRIAEKACLFLFPTAEESGSHVVHEDHLRIADPDRLARLFRMTSIEEVPEAKDVHEKLAYPEKLEEALSVEDDSELLSLLEWMYNYAPSCPSPDAAGCVGKLIDAANRMMSENRLSRESTSRFSRIMKRLLFLKTAGRDDAFLRIAKEAPLSISENVVLRAARDQGKWKIGGDEPKATSDQLVEDGNLVDGAIQAWSTRVRDCIARNDIHRETHLHSVLYRFAQFNDAYDEVYLAVWKMCETKDGLARFLSTFKEEELPIAINQLSLVEDSEKLAAIIDGSALKGKYAWLSTILKDAGTVKAVKEQADKLKEKPPASQA